LIKIHFSERRIFFCFIIIITSLTIFSILGQLSKYFWGHQWLFGFVGLFNLNMESNIPTLYQVLAIFFSSFLIYLIIKSKVKTKLIQHYWIMLMILTIYMGIDEATQIHESWSGAMKLIFPNQIKGIFSYSWFILEGVLALVVAIYFMNFIFRINKNVRILLIVAAAIYLSGALLVDIISSLFDSKFGTAFIYELLPTLEEVLEMLGIAVFIRALLKYIKMELITNNLNLEIEFY
jgi:hypothetical protein